MSEIKAPKLLDIDEKMPEQIEKLAEEMFLDHGRAITGMLYSWENLQQDARNRWRLRAFIERYG